MNHAAFSNRGLKQAPIIINNVNEKSKVKINYLKLCVDVSAWFFFFCTISFLRFKMVHRFNINANNAKVLSRQTIALWNSYALLFAHGSHFQRFCSLSLVLDMHFSSFKRCFFYSIASISFLCGYSFWIVHFYLREKKNGCDFDIWIIFLLLFVLAGDEPHKKCVYTRKIEIYRKLIAIWQRTLLFKLRHKVHFNEMPAGNVRLNWMAFSWRTKFHRNSLSRA